MDQSLSPIDNAFVPTSCSTADHYGWGEPCDGWHLVRAGALSVIEERVPPGSREVRHRHAAARQFFYVLAGVLTMEVDGTRHRLAPRTGIEIAPGAAHQAINESDAETEFLVVSAPPSHGDRMAADVCVEVAWGQIPKGSDPLGYCPSLVTGAAHIPPRRRHPDPARVISLPLIVLTLVRHMATRYVQPLREGGSLPRRRRYRARRPVRREIPRRGAGAKVLVAELIVGMIAQQLELPVPAMALVDVSDRFGRSGPIPRSGAAPAKSRDQRRRALSRGRLQLRRPRRHGPSIGQGRFFARGRHRAPAPRTGRAVRSVAESGAAAARSVYAAACLADDGCSTGSSHHRRRKRSRPCSSRHLRLRPAPAAVPRTCHAAAARTRPGRAPHFYRIDPAAAQIHALQIGRIEVAIQASPPPVAAPRVPPGPRGVARRAGRQCDARAAVRLRPELAMLLDLRGVTRSLMRLIELSVNASPAWPPLPSPALTVSPMPPDRLTGDPIAGLYLYHVTEDPAFKNIPPPPGVAELRYTPMALNLYFMLSARSGESDAGALTEQLIMGLAMKALRDMPVLDDASLVGGVLVLDPAIRGSENRVRIGLQPIPAAEAVSYWTAGSSPLRLAAYYQASVVLLEPDTPLQYAGRVLRYGVQTFTTGAPRLEATQSLVTYRLPGEAHDRTALARPAQVAPGGPFALLGSGLTGGTATLLIRPGAAAVPLVADAAWQLRDQRAGRDRPGAGHCQRHTAAARLLCRLGADGATHHPARRQQPRHHAKLQRNSDDHRARHDEPRRARRRRGIRHHRRWLRAGRRGRVATRRAARAETGNPVALSARRILGAGADGAACPPARRDRRAAATVPVRLIVAGSEGPPQWVVAP